MRRGGGQEEREREIEARGDGRLNKFALRGRFLFSLLARNLWAMFARPLQHIYWIARPRSAYVRPYQYSKCLVHSRRIFRWRKSFRLLDVASLLGPFHALVDGSSSHMKRNEIIHISIFVMGEKGEGKEGEQNSCAICQFSCCWKAAECRIGISWRFLCNRKVCLSLITCALIEIDRASRVIPRAWVFTTGDYESYFSFFLYIYFSKRVFLFCFLTVFFNLFKWENKFQSAGEHKSDNFVKALWSLRRLNLRNV